MAIFGPIGTPSLITPGATITWDYSFGSRGNDVGAAYAGASVKNPNAELIAFDHGKFLNSSGGTVYRVRIRNVGRVNVLHNIEGGHFK